MPVEPDIEDDEGPTREHRGSAVFAQMESKSPNPMMMKDCQEERWRICGDCLSGTPYDDCRYQKKERSPEVVSTTTNGDQNMLGPELLSPAQMRGPSFSNE